MFSGGAIEEDVTGYWETIGFEFEFSGLEVVLNDSDMNNALKEAHNKLIIELPEYLKKTVKEFAIGNDGPFRDNQYTLEFVVTYIQNGCKTIRDCYYSALELLNMYMHAKFYKLPGSTTMHNDDKQMTIIQKEDIDLHCVPQCTLGVKYENIETIIYNMYIDFDDYDDFDTDIDIIKEIVKEIIGINPLSKVDSTWIFLVSYYFRYINKFFGSKLLKMRMPFFLRHGLIRIMPSTLHDSMQRIVKKDELLDDPANETKIRINNYLYFLYFTRNFDSETVILQYNSNRKLILAPHESNFYDIEGVVTSETVLLLEYRNINIDNDLAGVKTDTGTAAEIISVNAIEAVKFDTVRTIKLEEAAAAAAAVSVTDVPKTDDYNVNYKNLLSNVLGLKSKTKNEMSINKLNKKEGAIVENPEYLEKIKKILGPKIPQPVPRTVSKRPLDTSSSASQSAQKKQFASQSLQSASKIPLDAFSALQSSQSALKIPFDALSASQSSTRANLAAAATSNYGGYNFHIYFHHCY